MPAGKPKRNQLGTLPVRCERRNQNATGSVALVFPRLNSYLALSSRVALPLHRAKNV